MAWTRTVNVNETAVVNNQNLELRLYFADAAATPPNHLRGELTVQLEGQAPIVIDQPMTALLPLAADRTALLALGAQIRDNALTLAGFVDTP